MTLKDLVLRLETLWHVREAQPHGTVPGDAAQWGGPSPWIWTQPPVSPSDRMTALVSRAPVRPTELTGGPVSSHPEVSESGEQQALGTRGQTLEQLPSPSLPRCSSRAGIGWR